MKSSWNLLLAVGAGVLFASLTLATLRYLYPEISMAFIVVAFPGTSVAYGGSIYWMLMKDTQKK